MSEAPSIDEAAGPGRLQAWFEACRSYSLTASVTPLLVGAAMAVRAGFFAPFRLLAALAGALAIHIGTNLINDYYDHVKGADSLDSLGGSKVIQRGLLTADEVWWGGMACLGAGSLAGLALSYACGWPILVIGLPSVAAGYFYTAPPFALAYNALGELAVFIFMGPAIVLGSYFVMALELGWAPLVASLPVGFLVTAILHANNVRDIETDPRYRKTTLANLFGRRAAAAEMALLCAAAYGTTAGAVVAGVLPWTVLATALTLPHAWAALRPVLSESTPAALDRAVLGSARLHLEFGLLLAGSILAAGALKL